MNPRARYFRLGAFVLGAVVVALAFVIGLGGGQWLRPKTVMESYFDESVQGIDVGTQVKYRGVSIGEVSRVGFTYTHYQQNRPPAERKPYVLVEAVVKPSEFTGGRGGIDQDDLQPYIDNGLRVRIAAQGITGAYYLELDYVDPRRNPPPPIDWKPDDLYIPSAPSPVGQIVSGAESLMRKLESANIDQVVVNLNALLGSVNHSLQALQTDRVGSNAVELLAELRETNRRLRSVVSDPGWQSLPRDAAATLSAVRKLVEGDELALTLGQLRQSLENLNRATVRLDRALVTPERDLPLILANLRETSENLREASDTLRRAPATALFADPPRPLPRPGSSRR
ncbi:MAG TPA: MlaD family protein [Burkholderiales bacterium]|nr:MlaD family protein [Burkholderiales bacterium]